MKTRIAKKIVRNTNKLRLWNVFGYGKKPKLRYSRHQMFQAAVLILFGDRNTAKLYAKRVTKKMQPWTNKDND